MPASKTKIIATVGPASRDPEVLDAMIAAGVDVFRVNCSHGEAEANAALVRAVRKRCDSSNRVVAVLADLQGPKLRVGDLDQPLELKKGQVVTFFCGDPANAGQRIPVDHPELAEDVTTGDRVLLCDGLIETEVILSESEEVVARVTKGGTLTSRKGVNLPGSGLKTRAPTEKDLADLPGVLEAGADFVALSFVRGPEDIVRLRRVIESLGYATPIVAKLERPEAINRLDAIISEADAVMVARGDLGIEIEPAMVPVVQKRIIVSALQHTKPVIVATEMLESMIDTPRPTRAEVSDVANAIVDGTDAVMLSAETAVGQYPVDAVREMARIAELTEGELDHVGRREEHKRHVTRTQALAHAAAQLVTDLRPRAIVVHTQTGTSARLVSAYRPPVPVVGLSPDPLTLRHLCLYYAVHPVATEQCESHEDLVTVANDLALESGVVDDRDLIILVSGTPGAVGGTDRLMIHEVSDPKRRDSEVMEGSASPPSLTGTLPAGSHH